MPVNPCDRVWVTAPTAALVEVGSTALMLLDPAEIVTFTQHIPHIRSIHVGHAGLIASLKNSIGP